MRDRILREKRADDMHSATLTQLAVAGLPGGRGVPGPSSAPRFLPRAPRRLIEATEKHLKGLATVATEAPNGGHLWLTLDLPLDESELMTEAVRNGVTFVPGAAMLPEGLASDPHAPLLRLPRARADGRGHRRLGRAIRSLVKRPRISEALPIA